GCLPAAPRPVTEGDGHRDGGRGRNRSWFAWLRGFPGQRERGGVRNFIPRGLTNTIMKSESSRGRRPLTVARGAVGRHEGTREDARKAGGRDYGGDKRMEGPKPRKRKLITNTG